MCGFKPARVRSPHGSHSSGAYCVQAFTGRKVGCYNGIFKHTHICNNKKKLHTLIRPITQQSSLIINDAASRVSEQVRPNPLALRLE